MKINSISSQYSYSNYNKEKNNKNTLQHNNSPAFKGAVPEPVVNGLSKFYEGLAKTKPFQGFIKAFSKSNNTFTHLMIAESCFLSGFYMINTLRNKNIKKEQKPQMLINDALTLGVSTAGAYLVEDKIGNMVVQGSEKYFAKNAEFYKNLGKKAAEGSKNGLLEKVGKLFDGDDASKLATGIDDVVKEVGTHLKGIVGEKGKEKAFQLTDDAVKNITTGVKNAISTNSKDATKAKEAVKLLVDDAYDRVAARAEADKLMPGINKLKVLIIFGIIYRYLGPVVITPIANKISSKFFDKKKPQEAKTQAAK